MLYFPVIWVISVLFYTLFFVKLNKSEIKHKIAVERYPNNKFPIIRNIKLIIRNTTDKNVKKDFKLILSFLYIAYTLFYIPIIIYFIVSILF
jgi:hypothetical protein